MVWVCSDVLWFSKDNPVGHSERTKKKKEADRRRGGKIIPKSGQEWILPAQLGQHYILRRGVRWGVRGLKYSKLAIAKIPPINSIKVNNVYMTIPLYVVNQRKTYNYS